MGSSRSFILFAAVVIGVAVGSQAIFSRVPLNKTPVNARVESPTSGSLASGSEDSVIPLERSGGVWVATVEFNDLYETKLVVDTGATFTTISENLAFDSGIQPDTRNPGVQLHTAGGIVQAKMGTAQRIRVGHAERDDVRVVIHTLPDFPEDVEGLLGLSFFEGFLVRLDHSQRQLHLTPKH